jgi:hypothetical protein
VTLETDGVLVMEGADDVLVTLGADKFESSSSVVKVSS